MRVGLLTTSFPRWPGDVAGHFVLGFARALVERGHSVDVIAPEPPEPVQLPAFDGVELHWLPYLRPRALQRTFYGAGVPDNLRADPRAWLGPLPFSAALAVAVLQRRARWDALVSHFGVPCGLIGGALKQRRPHLCVQHSADLHALQRLPAGARCARAIARGADTLWFVSTAARDGFMQRLAPEDRTAAHARSTVQPMGFELAPPPAAERAALRTRLGIERFALLTLARLVPVKGLPDAVRALAHRGDLEWLIAGDGPDRAALEAIARASSLRVRLLGTVAEEHKSALLHAADAFVLPSRVLRSGRSEGAPTALLEAMAAGLPVIAADVGGVGELLAGGDRGWLFDSTTSAALERAVDGLRSAPASAQARLARARDFAGAQRWCELAPRIEACLARSHARAFAPAGAA